MPRHPTMLVLLAACAGCFYVTESERLDRWDLDGDGIERPADCNDADPDLTDTTTFYADADGDGFGDPESPTIACEAPAGFVADSTDCNDADSLTFPGAAERCDGADNDCDRDIDEGLSQVEWFPDLDGDDFGDDDGSVRACGRPEGYVASGGDCDDGLAEVNPDAVEVCNGIDDDCANGIDQADPNVVLATWYLDVDGDLYGDDPTLVEACDAPDVSWVEVGGDCRPADPLVNPGADELCNDIDDDCDGFVDIDAVDATRYYTDDDGDGYGDVSFPIDACPAAPDSGDTGQLDPCSLAPSGMSCSPSDCNDNNADINPSADEICANGVNEDCDGLTDEGDCVP